MTDTTQPLIWQVVASVATVVAILVSIGLYLVQRQRKAMSYEILSRTPLISAEEEVQGKLQILFEGSPVKQVTLVAVRIWNSGNVTVTADDYERPIKLSFGPRGQVLTADTIEALPENLRTAIAVLDRRELELRPVLFNRGDSLTIRALVSQFEDDLAIDGRIAGVKQIQLQRLVDGRTVTVLLFGGFAILLISVGMYSFLWSRLSPLTFEITYWPVAILGYILILAGVWRESRRSRRSRVGRR